MHTREELIRHRTEEPSFPLAKSMTQVVRLEAGKIYRMDTLDYVLAIGGVLVFIFTIVMDVLLVREWIQKRRDKQKPPESSDT